MLTEIIHRLIIQRFQYQLVVVKVVLAAMILQAMVVPAAQVVVEDIKLQEQDMVEEPAEHQVAQELQVKEIVVVTADMICLLFGVYVAAVAVVPVQLRQLLALVEVDLAVQVLHHHYLDHLYFMPVAVQVLHTSIPIQDQILYL
jgi:hypothetical protein